MSYNVAAINNSGICASVGMSTGKLFASRLHRRTCL